MPRKKKQPEGPEQYDLDDIFKREASDAVEVRFHLKDPGYALSARAYLGEAARTILAFFDQTSRRWVAEDGWSEEERRLEVEACAKRALLTFAQQLEEKLDEAYDELIFESLAQIMREGIQGVEIDDPELMSESDMIQFALRTGEERKKRRLSAPQRGAPRSWTRERRAEFLRLYERLYGQVKGAKRMFRGEASDKGWLDAVREAYPELPESVLAKLHLWGHKPSDLAREAAAEVMGLPASEYLTRVLVEARREASEVSENG